MASRAMELPDRLAGAIWGHLVGDAVGVPYEFRPPAAIGEITFGASGTHGQPPGTWSDDGALMLALLDSLLEAGFDVEDQGRRALAWYTDGAYTPDGDGRFDVGGATRAAMRGIRGGAAAATAGGTGDRDNGNGSLMRILSLALVAVDSERGAAGLADAELVDRAHRASAVTHGHAIAQAACALYVLVARRLLAGSGGRSAALAGARRALRAVYAGDPVRTSALDTLEGWTGRSGRGYVVDSLWSAWDAFAGAESYADTIVRAVRYGNDTDTTAAIAGGLAGLRWGIGGIPRDWMAGMRGAAIVYPLIDRLIERADAGWRTSTGNPIRVAWVDHGIDDDPDIGRFGITFLPGKRDGAGRSGSHWRTVRTDLAGLRADKVTRLLVLVEDHELEALGVGGLEAAGEAAGVRVVRFPIPDLGVPADHAAFARQALWQLHQWMRLGHSVAIACRGGLGRSGLVAACMLVDYRFDPAESIARVRAVRPGAIETPEQEAFVAAHAVFRGGGDP